MIARQSQPWGEFPNHKNKYQHRPLLQALVRTTISGQTPTYGIIILVRGSYLGKKVSNTYVTTSETTSDIRGISVFYRILPEISRYVRICSTRVPKTAKSPYPLLTVGLEPIRGTEMGCIFTTLGKVYLTSPCFVTFSFFRGGLRSRNYCFTRYGKSQDCVPSSFYATHCT